MHFFPPGANARFVLVDGASVSFDDSGQGQTLVVVLVAAAYASMTFSASISLRSW